MTQTKHDHTITIVPPICAAKGELHPQWVGLTLPLELAHCGGDIEDMTEADRPQYNFWTVVVLDGPLVLTQVGIGETAVVVDLEILRVEAYGFIVVLDGLLVLTETMVGNSTVRVSVGILRGKA